ncbi:MAG: ABC transporter permease, partial [Frankia sp.]
MSTVGPVAALPGPATPEVPPKPTVPSKPAVPRSVAEGLAATEPPAVALGRRTAFGPALAAVYAGQLARARVARIPVLFVAAFQSVGILLLL